MKSVNFVDSVLDDLFFSLYEKEREDCDFHTEHLDLMQDNLCSLCESQCDYPDAVMSDIVQYQVYSQLQAFKVGFRVAVSVILSS